MRRLALVAVVLLFPSTAYLARAPDVVEVRQEYRGDPGRNLAALLGLTEGTTLTLEQSQSQELHAHPERDRALRDERGLLSSELDWRVSADMRATIRWDGQVLHVAGWVSDVTTALPAQPGPRYRLVSPVFSAIDELPGWRPLLERLGDRDRIEVALDTEQRAILERRRFETWTAKNQPITKNMLTISFGPDSAPPRSGCAR